MAIQGFTVDSRLEAKVVSELRKLVREVPVGKQLTVPLSTDVLYSLEVFLPQLLSCRYPEWSFESFDGFFVGHAVKTGPNGLQMSGTCILITDQAMTPFSVYLEWSPTADSVAAFRVQVGEPGAGPLGISGPAYGSAKAFRLLANLTTRLDEVEWSYTVASDEIDVPTTDPFRSAVPPPRSLRALRRPG